MVRVLVVGAGGHGQVVADILLRMQENLEDVEPVGYLDDDPQLVGCWFLGLPVLGTTYDAGGVDHDAVIVAIGDNATRRGLFETLRNAGERLFTARHPQTIVGRNVTLGEGTVVCAGVIVSTGCVIGSNVILNSGCSVDHHDRIGDHVHLAPGVRLGGDVTIGEGVFVGIGATILPRQHVGDWNVVGAGAVVCDDFPDGVTIAGVPARLLEKQARKRPAAVVAHGTAMKVSVQKLEAGRLK